MLPARFKEETAKSLRIQGGLELEASANYLAFSLWANRCGLFNFEKYFYDNSLEETGHFKMIANFLLDNNIPINKPAVEAIELKEWTLLDVITSSYKQEKAVTQHLGQIKEVAYKNKDYLAVEFIHDMIVEQIEEEAKWSNLYDRLMLLKDAPTQSYDLDKELPKLIKNKMI